MSTPGDLLSRVPGVPETQLTGELLDALPLAAPPPPWTLRLHGVVWGHVGGTAAGRALPPLLRGRRALVAGGAVLRYTESPVGPYDEVAGVVGTRDRVRPVGTVTFMAVDSPVSLVGGRAGWGMPKTVATFSGDPGRGSLVATSRGRCRWQVTVTATARGPRFPVAVRLPARQQLPDGGLGDCSLRGRARARLAVVTVGVESEGPLPTWLRPGRHLGAAIETASLVLSEPTSPVLRPRRQWAPSGDRDRDRE